MAEPKTRQTTESVAAFIAGVADEATRKDCTALVRLMKRASGSPAKMWGTSIVGFGTYPSLYGSGEVREWPLTGFSPRKRELTLYVMSGFDRHAILMKKLGRCRTGKSCLYVKSLADVDLGVLETLVAESVVWMRKRYPPIKAKPAKR